MAKSMWREKLIKERSQITENEAKTRSKQIAVSLLKSFDWKSIKSVSIYASIKQLNEVDTSLIRAELHSQWPDIKLSVLAPKKIMTIPSEPYDMIIVPVVGFDSSLHRLGMGGGFYDKFLANQPQALKVGLAYDRSRIDGPVAWEQHDIPLDMIVTESIIIPDDYPSSKNKKN